VSHAASKARTKSDVGQQRTLERLLWIVHEDFGQDPRVIGRGSSLSDLELDSLELSELEVVINNEFDVDIDFEEIDHGITLASLAERIDGLP
jgi:acyl carrier protein